MSSLVLVWYSSLFLFSWNTFCVGFDDSFIMRFAHVTMPLYVPSLIVFCACFYVLLFFISFVSCFRLVLYLGGFLCMLLGFVPFENPMGFSEKIPASSCFCS